MMFRWSWLVIVMHVVLIVVYCVVWRFYGDMWICNKICIKAFVVVVDLRSAVVMSPTLAAVVVGKPPSSICCCVCGHFGGDDGVSMSPWRGIHCSHVVMLFDTL
ncbi:hypothetical protein QVD17_19440 [Tagetes erecta]|uniref:Uncharacterized protein n=1 Tax=Tagetes erecta TaxID=13708 RepID=A0AAD8NQ26_TARER|nr:hypothetical protein QVD17_19440 [Tagetes erecta]